MKAMSGKLNVNQLYFPNQFLSLISFITTTHINLVESNLKSSCKR